MDTIKILIIVGILGLFVLAALTTEFPAVPTSEPTVIEPGPTITVEPEPETEPAPEVVVTPEPTPEPIPEPQTPPAAS